MVGFREKKPMLLQYKKLLPYASVVILLVVVVGFLGVQWGKFTSSNELEEYRMEMLEWKNAALFSDSVSNVYEQKRDSLLTEVQILHNTTDTLTSTINVLQGRIRDIQPRLDSMSTIVNSIPDLPLIVVEYIDDLESQNTLLKTNLSAAERLTQTVQTQLSITTQALELETRRADDLQELVNLVPTNVPTPDKLLGLIPLPSRTTTFFIGAGLSAFTTILVTN